MRAAGYQPEARALELGGKSPNIVFADADMDEAIEGRTRVFFNQGECCARDRVCTSRKSATRVVEKKRGARTKKRTVGNPFDKKHRAGAE